MSFISKHVENLEHVNNCATYAQMATFRHTALTPTFRSLGVSISRAEEPKIGHRLRIDAHKSIDINRCDAFSVEQFRFLSPFFLV